MNYMRNVEMHLTSWIRQYMPALENRYNETAPQGITDFKNQNYVAISKSCNLKRNAMYFSYQPAF